MLKIDSVVDLDLAAGTETESGTGKITKAVNGNAGSLLEAGNEEGRGEMREVVFDMVNLGFDRNLIFRFERIFDRRGAANVFDLLPHQLGVRPMGNDKAKPPPIVRTRLPIDRDMIDVV